jgi:hypothetical protein
LQYYLAALLHDIGKLDLPLRDASKLKGPHPIKGNLYLQDFYRNEYNNELKIILPAVTLHHDNVVRDYPNHEIVKAAIETKNYCPTSKSILDAVQKSDRSAASASRDRDKKQDKDKSCSKKSQKPPYPETILPGKNNIPVLQKIPPYWAVDKSYYNNAIVPEKFNTHSRSWEVPLPDNPNLLSDDVILFNQQIKEMYINRYEDQKNAPDISLWSHVSLTAALASCYRSNPNKEIYLAVIGLFLTFIVALMVLPLLLEADSGGFTQLIKGILEGFRGIGQDFWETFWQAILAIPIAAYIFALVAGSTHKRGTDLFDQESTIKSISGLRILPLTTVYILMSSLTIIYFVFIGSQLPYFFSAFAGQRPEGWQIYSEYARSGFFELCRIAVINLLVLTASNIMSQQPRKNILLKILNALLALLTLLLIATAFSKMALYIGAYGLSMRRFLPCVFMIFMAIICGGVIALQKWSFSISRLAVGVGVIMFCTLCIVNPDSLVARYNAQRYLSGTLENFDVEILYRSGPAGVDSALRVYEIDNGPELQFKLKEYLLIQQQQAEEVAGQPGDNWERAQVRQEISQYLD